MLRKPRRLRSLILPLVLCVAGCRGSELNTLFGDCLAVGRNAGKHVEVTCMNSPFAERPEAERVVTARKVAEYVRDRYAIYEDARDVTVIFMSKKETAKGDFKHPQAQYAFTRAELGEPPALGKRVLKPDTSAADSAAAPPDSAVAPG